jgi:signal transduction histidine kinase
MKDFYTVKSRNGVKKVFQAFSLFSIVFTIFLKYSSDAQVIIFLIFIMLLMVGNDLVRARFQQHQLKVTWSISFIVSNLLAGFLLYKAYSIGSQIYIIILLVEIMVNTKKIPIYFISLNFIIFTTSLLATHTLIEDILPSYFIIFAVVYLFRNVLIEKAKTQELNQELQIANATLQTYSEKMEELTISKERTRIAQQLHDSLGHYLIALNMNLEYANTIVDVEPSKAKLALNKSHDITKECMVDLRKTVALLAEERSSKNLQQALHEIFDNFCQTNQIKFELDMDEAMEQVDSDIKNCIYKTVQECITNGIKHGKATYFSIKIHALAHQISFGIYNNGDGCETMIKSKGILGIEERIEALGGRVDFNSSDRQGFRVEAIIPQINLS